MEDVILDYHEATKHHFYRFARSLGYLDWETQPNPFRYYEGTSQIHLDRFPQIEARPYPVLYDDSGIRPRAIDHASLSEFFRYSAAISAWKQYGDARWALRVDPSSGNLHPTEVYCVLGAGLGLTDEPGVFHYVSETHILERRGRLPKSAWELLTSGPSSESFLVGVCSIHWREAWKYGERAYRYCQHDAGHVLATLRLSAALLGWRMRLIDGGSDRIAAALLGLGREESGAEAEREVPDFIARVSRQEIENGSPSDEKVLNNALHDAQWFGRANPLSRDHIEWSAIDQVHKAAQNPGGVHIGSLPTSRTATVADHEPSSPEAHQIILQRRSALAYDASGTLSLNAFLKMMQRTLPGPHAPWDALYWPPCIHFALFIHRVIGLEPGLYMLIRNPDVQNMLQKSTSPDFVWKRPSRVPEGFPLFLLREGDIRSEAATLSCNQDVAGDSHFSLGMIAEFAEPIRKWGPWFYRNLFWESGTVGQVLYLEAEAAGARATGIG